MQICLKKKHRYISLEKVKTYLILFLYDFYNKACDIFAYVFSKNYSSGMIYYNLQLSIHIVTVLSKIIF